MYSILYSNSNTGGFQAHFKIPDSHKIRDITGGDINLKWHFKLIRIYIYESDNSYKKEECL